MLDIQADGCSAAYQFIVVCMHGMHGCSSIACTHLDLVQLAARLVQSALYHVRLLLKLHALQLELLLKLNLLIHCLLLALPHL